MKAAFVWFIALAIAASCTAESGQVFEITVEPLPPEKFKLASYSLWIPDNTGSLRAVIVHQHGCGRNGITLPHDVHWRELARKWSCALMGTHYQATSSCTDWCDPDNGSGRAFLAALKTLADKSRHPELENAPWVLWGHSGGAAWVCAMLESRPDRVVAAFPRSLPWGRGYSRANEVPVMLSMGIQEERGRFAGIWRATKELFARRRAENALICLAVDPKASHDCRNSRLLAIPFFDACLQQRLPAPGSVGLRPMEPRDAWLGNPVTSEIAPLSQYTSDVNEAVWLPDRATAERWRQFVRTGWVSDTTAPEPPGNLKLLSLTADSAELTWTARADLESGIKTFRYYRNGKKIGDYEGHPENHHNPEGGFQKGNYGDEPTPESLYEQPSLWIKPRMSFVDDDLEPDTTYTWRITTVNWSGLVSEKSRPLSVTTPPQTPTAQAPDAEPDSAGQ